MSLYNIRTIYHENEFEHFNETIDNDTNETTEPSSKSKKQIRKKRQKARKKKILKKTGDISKNALKKTGSFFKNLGSGSNWIIMIIIAVVVLGFMGLAYKFFKG